jgi:hypothetical protein
MLRVWVFGIGICAAVAISSVLEFLRRVVVPGAAAGECGRRKGERSHQHGDRRGESSRSRVRRTVRI